MISKRYSYFTGMMTANAPISYFTLFLPGNANVSSAREMDDRPEVSVFFIGIVQRAPKRFVFHSKARHVFRCLFKSSRSVRQKEICRTFVWGSRKEQPQMAQAKPLGLTISLAPMKVLQKPGEFVYMRFFSCAEKPANAACPRIAYERADAFTGIRHASESSQVARDTLDQPCMPD